MFKEQIGKSFEKKIILLLFCCVLTCGSVRRTKLQPLVPIPGSHKRGLGGISGLISSLLWSGAVYLPLTPALSIPLPQWQMLQASPCVPAREKEAGIKQEGRKEAGMRQERGRN